MGYLGWVPNVTGEKFLCQNRGLNPVRWTQSPTLYRIAIKASLYHKAVQVCHIVIYEGKSISNQPIPFPIGRDTQDFHALFQYMF